MSGNRPADNPPIDIYEGLPLIFRHLTDGVRRGIDLSTPWRYEKHVYACDGYGVVRCPVDAIEWHILDAIRDLDNHHAYWYASLWREETPDLYRDNPVKIGLRAGTKAEFFVRYNLMLLAEHHIKILKTCDAAVFLPRDDRMRVRFTAGDSDGFMDCWWSSRFAR